MKITWKTCFFLGGQRLFALFVYPLLGRWHVPAIGLIAGGFPPALGLRDRLCHQYFDVLFGAAFTQSAGKAPSGQGKKGPLPIGGLCAFGFTCLFGAVLGLAAVDGDFAIAAHPSA